MTTLTLYPDIDTDINAAAATTNYGTNVRVYIGAFYGNARRTLIKPDLSTLPVNAVISSAVLSIYQVVDNTNGATGTVKVYRLKRDWVETEATWNIYSTGNNWQTAGAGGANDRESTEIGSLAFDANEPDLAFWDIPLTPTSKAGLDLGYGWLIKSDLEVDNDQYGFASSDTVDPAEPPKLVITYDLRPEFIKTPFWGRF